MRGLLFYMCYNYFMTHTCKALVLHCIDFRLGQPIKKYLEGQNLLGDADIVAVAGAAKNLVSPASQAESDFVMKQIEISRRLHHIQEIILINHTDCGAYGGNDELVASDLPESAAKINEKFPDLKIKMVLAKIDSQNNINFENIN